MTVEKVLMDLADALTVEAYNGTSTLHEIIADGFYSRTNVFELKFV